MSVSLYYCATRAMPLTDAETAAVERIVAAHPESFPYEDQESLCLYDSDAGRPGEIVAGSTKMPLDPGRVLPVLDHVLSSVSELRRVLPGAEWRVHMDDLESRGTGVRAMPSPVCAIRTSRPSWAASEAVTALTRAAGVGSRRCLAGSRRCLAEAPGAGVLHRNVKPDGVGDGRTGRVRYGIGRAGCPRGRAGDLINGGFAGSRGDPGGRGGDISSGGGAKRVRAMRARSRPVAVSAGDGR